MNNTEFIAHFNFFDTLMNHWWNGDAAAFTIIETVAKRYTGIAISLRNPPQEVPISKMAEAITWIRRYFIVLSLLFWAFILETLFIRAQKERVFNSSIVQIASQEFPRTQKMEEKMRIRSMVALVLRNLLAPGRPGIKICLSLLCFEDT